MIPWLLPLGMRIAAHRWGCCRCAWGGGTVPFGCACAVRKGHLPCHPATGADFLICVSVNQPSVGAFQEGGSSRSSGLDSSGSARRCRPGANTQLCARVGEYCRQLVPHAQRAKRGAVVCCSFLPHISLPSACSLSCLLKAGTGQEEHISAWGCMEVK